MILDSAIGIDAPDPLSRDTLSAVPRVLRAVCRAGCSRRPGASRVRPRTARDAAAPDRDPPRRAPRRPPDQRHPARRRRPQPARLRRPLSGLCSAGSRARSARRCAATAISCSRSCSTPPTTRTTSRSASSAGASTSPRRARRVRSRGIRAPIPRRARSRLARSSPRRRCARSPPSTARPRCASGSCRCAAHWPAPTRVAAPEPPLPTTIPTLVLAGEVDLRTPLEGARRLARALHGRLVVEKGIGHGVLGENPRAARRRPSARVPRGTAAAGLPALTTLQRAAAVRAALGRCSLSRSRPRRPPGPRASARARRPARSSDVARGSPSASRRAMRYELRVALAGEHADRHLQLAETVPDGRHGARADAAQGSREAGGRVA